MKTRFLLLATAMMTLSAPLWAQQPANPPSTGTGNETAPPAAPPAQPNETTKPAAAAQASAKPGFTQAPDAPNADLLKKARNAGYHTKVAHNVVVFCKTEATIGSRFEKENCYNQTQFEQRMDYEQAQRDQFRNAGACVGSSCNGMGHN